MEEFLPFAQQYGYLAIFAVLLAAGLGFPMPEDIPLITGGWMCYIGALNIWTTIAIALVGVMLGDCMIFLLGRKAGHLVNEVAFLNRWLGGPQKAKVERYFERWGNQTIFFGRFLAGLRAPTFFTAGVSGMPFRTFVLYDGLAALLSVPLVTALGLWFGSELEALFGWLLQAKRVSLSVALALGIILLIRFLLKRRKAQKHDEGATEKESL